MLRASVAALPIVERNNIKHAKYMHKTRTKHTFGVDFRRKSGFSIVSTDFLCSFQCQSLLLRSLLA